MPGQRLLIVDNDRAFLKEHQVGLEASFDVEVIPAPDTTIERLESGAFACVLISVEIADNRGYALCASIRRSSKLSAVRVVLISAKATPDEYKRHQGLKGRADLYLMKPIPSVNLVEALRPLVPPRGLDPDNPLGDLADDGDLGGDLAGDWLGDLKSDLDLGFPEAKAPAHAAGTVAISPAQIQAALSAIPLPASTRSSQATAPPGAMRPDMAVAQVAHLQEELAAKHQKLQETEEALVQLQRQLNSVTVNLDELDRSKKESANLQAKLAAAEAAVNNVGNSNDTEALRQQLRDAIGERQQLIQQADNLNQQLAEKTTRTIELLRERDKLQSQVLESSSLQAKLESAEAEVGKFKAASGQSKDEITGLEATVRGQGRQLAQMQDALSEAEARLKATEEKASSHADTLKDAEEAKVALAKDIETAMRDTKALQVDLEEAKSRHERERMELMGGLDLKESELNRLKEQLKSATEASTERGEKLKALATLLEELAETLRKGSGLAKE